MYVFWYHLDPPERLFAKHSVQVEFQIYLAASNGGFHDHYRSIFLCVQLRLSGWMCNGR